MSILLDSYSETNKDSFGNTYAGGSIARGETFIVGRKTKLCSCKFYLSKVNPGTALSGNITAKLWNITGTMGTNAMPTGLALAASNPINVTTIKANPTFDLVEFIFPAGQQPLINVGNYCITLVYNGGDVNNYLAVGRRNWNNAYPGRNRVWSTDESTWLASSENVTIFYVYGTTVRGNQSEDIEIGIGI